MCETTSQEFVGWQEYINKERSVPRREDYYLAQIAAEIRRGVVKTPASVKLEHFLLAFSTRKEHITDTDKVKQQAASSKAWWFQLLHLKQPMNPPLEEK